MRSGLTSTVVIGIAAVVPLVLAGCGSTSGQSSQASPTTTAVGTTFYGQAVPPNAPKEKMVMYSVVVPPGGSVPEHQHPGLQLGRVTAGELTYTILAGSLIVFDGTVSSGLVPSHNVEGPTTITLSPGTSFAERSGMLHKAQNKGTVPVTIEATVLVPADGPISVTPSE